jgi:preprotein translocase subunit SecB
MSDPKPPQGVNYQITTQYVKDLSFENPRAPEAFAQNKQPQVGVTVGVSARQLGEKLYEVTLEIKADAKTDDGALFMVELAYAAVVGTESVAPPEHLGPLLMIDIPRQIFPFARAVVSNITREGGFPSLMLAPVDFIELYRKRVASAEEQQKQAAKPA